MFQTSVQDFFDAVKFGTPDFLQFLETAFERVKARIRIVEAGPNVVEATVHVGSQIESLELLTRMPSSTASMVGTDASTMVRI